MSAEGSITLTPQVVPLMAPTSAAAAPAGPIAPEISFHDVLQALNPLQYLPGIGTLYRAVTGDTPPESTRVIGSIIAGGLLGGPIGAAISAVSSFVQHVSGIDLDHIAHDVLAELGLVSDPHPPPIAAPRPTALPAPMTVASTAEATLPVGSAAAESAPVITTTLQLRVARAAYSPDPVSTGQRLGHI